LNDQSTKAPLRILVIGSLDVSAGGASVGGTTILLRCLVNELQRRQDVELSVLDIGCSRHKTGLLKDIGRGISFLCRAPSYIRVVDVVTVHLCSPSSLGLPGLIVSCFFRKPLVIRKFGGNDYRASRAYCWPWLAEFVLRRADLYLAETRQLVDQASWRGIVHTEWFPTHRPMNSVAKPGHEKTGCHRFVYVGQVREYKGIRELVEAAERLDSSTTVDVYGPIFDDLSPDIFDRCRHIFYRGVLDHRDVVSTIQQYDALVLPTHHDGEGYPGVILEAYSVGLPVVTTNWRAIPEIVDETSGILVEPRNPEALYQAMRKLSTDLDLYVRLCKGARRRADAFSAEHWAGQFVTFCRLIAKKGANEVGHPRTGHRI